LVVVDGAVEKALDRVNCVVLVQEEFLGDVDVGVKESVVKASEAEVKASEDEVKAPEAEVILSVLDVTVVE
jgi:hypothetical protein